jgi:hypothetical protein
VILSRRRLLQIAHLIVTGLDLREFTLDGHADRAGKLGVQYDLLEDLFDVIFARLDSAMIDASDPPIFCLRPANRIFPDWAMSPGLSARLFTRVWSRSAIS